MVIGLDQPGTAVERSDEKVLLSVDDDADSLSREPLHDPLVDVAGEGSGNTPGDHQDIAGGEQVKLFV